ncbi:MAG: hypothetical protein P4L50_03145 [Anaerolineaceae bacterium]|nr:hypothetical protein [Anaerolineaceae bacterium]
MKERPIIFSSQMVRAILEGRKTQTRRALRKQPIDIIPMNVPNEWITLHTRNPGHGHIATCRFGIPGDRLWVRETWATVKSYDHLKPSLIPRGDARWPMVWYAADPWGGIKTTTSTFVGKERSGIFMPRWASRITLEIVNIRVNQVQSMLMNEVVCEGVFPYMMPKELGDPRDPMTQYIDLWDKLNSKRGFSWSSNPWVWVITFRRIQP